MTFISRSNGSSYPFKKIVNHLNSVSYPLKRSSTFGTVRAVPSKNICQPFQLSVGKKQHSNQQFFIWKMKNDLHLQHSESSSAVTLLVLHVDWMIRKNAFNQGRANSVTDTSLHKKKSSKHFKVPGIVSNIPRNKSALVMGICTTFTCFQTPLRRKHSTIETSLKSICRSGILVISTYKTCIWSLQANTRYFVVLTEPVLQKSM